MVKNMNLLLSGEGIKGPWVGTWHDTNYILRSLFLTYREWNGRGHRETSYESGAVFQGKDNKIGWSQSGSSGDRK